MQLSQATPIARLTSEYNVFVVPASSPLRTMKDVVAQLKKEQGYDVILGNWRGVYAAPGIGAEARDAFTSAVLAATRSKSWSEALIKQSWTPAVLTGKDFEDFVEYEFSSLRAIMYLSGMV